MTKNMNPTLEQYLDLLVNTSDPTWEKRWVDLRRNLYSRIKKNLFYVTPDEATGIRMNARKNKRIKNYTIPAELEIIVSDALDDQPSTVSLPDKKEEPVTNADEVILAFAEMIARGEVSPNEAREIMGLMPAEEVEEEKPTPLDHSLWDLKVKKSEVALNDAAADLIKFCKDWANELRNGK